MKPPVRIHAGNNGVYDAVHHDGAWLIRYRPYVAITATLVELVAASEFSVTSYETAHEAQLAYERGPITYRSDEVVA